MEPTPSPSATPLDTVLALDPSQWGVLVIVAAIALFGIGMLVGVNL